MEINLAAGQRSGSGHVPRIVRTESDSYLCRQRHPAGSDRRFRARHRGVCSQRDSDGYGNRLYDGGGGTVTARSHIAKEGDDLASYRDLFRYGSLFHHPVGLSVQFHIITLYKAYSVMKILILCTGNSCRSQMAHGFLQSFDASLEVYSGGTEPAAQVNPKAVEVMKEAGIDISSHTPVSVRTYLDQAWDYVITVCGGANESCPAFTGKVGKRLHIGFDDPSHATGTPEFIEAEFRRVRDEIRERFHSFYLSELCRK